MEIMINIRKMHLYVLFGLLAVFFGVILVNAFGTSDPTVFGHSAGELVVTGDSITNGTIVAEDLVANTLTGNEILESSLGAVPIASDLSCTNCIGPTEVDISFDCQTKTTTVSGSAQLTATATLDSGYVVTGGGCYESSFNRGVWRSYPSGTMAWICVTTDSHSQATAGDATAYVRGCKLT